MPVRRAVSMRVGPWLPVLFVVAACSSSAPAAEDRCLHWDRRAELPFPTASLEASPEGPGLGAYFCLGPHPRGDDGLVSGCQVVVEIPQPHGGAPCDPLAGATVDTGRVEADATRCVVPQVPVLSEGGELAPADAPGWFFDDFSAYSAQRACAAAAPRPALGLIRLTQDVARPHGATVWLECSYRVCGERAADGGA